MPSQLTRSSTVMNPVKAIQATVQVMDEHGKVVHDTSKTFFSAFREAKQAYRARKAEIAAERLAERRAREQLRRRHTTMPSTHRIEDVPAEDNSSALTRSSTSSKNRRQRPKRAHTDNFGGHVSEDEIEDLAVVRHGSSANDIRDDDSLYAPGPARHSQDLTPANSAAIQGLAAPMFNDPAVRAISETLTHVQSIIDEFSCMAAGLSKLVSELQKAPDALAAVGLALAEISSLVAKISPVVLPILQNNFPTVFALISSPHFAIVAGIGTAATVVVLGGYKIIKNVIAGAEENRKLAEDDGYDSDLIIGDIYEDEIDEPQHRGRIEELSSAGMPSPAMIEEQKMIELQIKEAQMREMHMREQQKRLMPPTPPVTPPGEVLGFDLREDSKKEKKHKSQSTVSSNSDKEREKRKAEKKEKEREKEREHRKGKDKEHSKKEKSDKEKEKDRKERPKELRRGSTQGSSISMSSSKNEKHEKSQESGEKKKKRGFKALFEGRSA